MIKAIIFDFDGVIVDSEKKKFNDLQQILHNMNFNLKKTDFIEMMGKKTGAFLSLKFPEMNQAEIKKITELRRERLFLNPNIKLIPGVKDLLEFIKLNKIKTTITTGSTKNLVKKVIEIKGIKNYFDIIIAGEDFKETKPSPECYNLTLKKLNLNPSEVIIIEDSIAGVKASKSANCRVFGLMTYLNKVELRDADKVFANHFEILDYFKKKEIIE
jgi:HAD superfamily hydrolase (TIGR01509 family)